MVIDAEEEPGRPLPREKELKIGVIYEGCTQRYPSSKEYKTIGKTAFAGYMKSEEFKNLERGDGGGEIQYG